MWYRDIFRNRYIPFNIIRWDVRREPRPWHGEEFDDSYNAMPEKMEACDGMIYCDDDDRLKVLGALLENVGIDRAIRIGDPALWKAAVADLPDEPSGPLVDRD